MQRAAPFTAQIGVLESESEQNSSSYRARYYDPQSGRFLNEDPIKFDGGVNFYSYASDDPISLTDPSGLKCNPPNFSALWKNYPTPANYPTAVDPPGKTSVWDLVGGKVAQNGNNKTFSNSCAIRLSYALNQSGCEIPYAKGKTVSGDDGNWYFFRLADLSAFLQSQWGAPQTLGTDNWKSALANQTGIIAYQVQWADATGHLSLWNGQTNVDGPAHDYSNPATRNNAPFTGMLFWPLK